MNIRFFCPECEQPSRLALPGRSEWQCSTCDHVLRLPAANDQPLRSCLICGNREFYRKKNFPHALGLTVLTLACGAFLITSLLYHQWLAWAILIGSAILDGGLYLLVGDVAVCYRCGAHHRGWPGDSLLPPFDLSIAERCRQERLRREQIPEKKP